MTDREEDLEYLLLAQLGDNLEEDGQHSVLHPPPFELTSQSIFIEPQPYEPPPYQPVRRNNLHRPDDYKRGLYFAIIAFIVVTIIGTPLTLVFTIPALCLNIWAWKLQEQEHYRCRAKAMMICGYALDIFAIFFVFALFFTIYVLNAPGVLYQD